MSRRTARSRKSGLEPGINLTPMLDMIFNLLFFFVLATQIRTNARQMEVQLPEAGSAVAADEKKAPPVVTLDAKGNIYFNERPVVEEELALYLHHLAGGVKKS
ncbi:MAG: biopolymer transporter ExbD, partial [bacterium]|nr:biopolymer transporter ExbD [bacterium]